MTELPPCGLYRTTQALPGKEDWVRENLLVYFHNHSQQGPPLLLLPSTNQLNRWSFHDKGYLVRDPGFVPTLAPLKAEGFYVLSESIFLSKDEMIPERTLVQLGYNRTGDPILFLGDISENQVAFPTSGLKCTLDIFGLLNDVNFRVPIINDMH